VGYLQNITRLSQADNLAGLVQLQVIRKSDLTLIPAPVLGIVYGALTYAPGGGFVTWDCKLETPRITTEEQGSNQGSSKRNVLRLTIPKDRSNLRYLFSLMMNDEFIIIFTENGKKKIFGQLHAPVRFTWNHDSGASFDQLNSYECQFYYTGPDNVFFYEGAISTAPAGPAPAVVSFNGTPIASLAPGETLNIISEYLFTEYFTTTP
jgi:hypothetical protein